jgi:hypothetical protein
VFEPGFRTLESLAVSEDSPDHEPVFEQVMEDEHGTRRLRSQGGARLLPAESVQGTYHCHIHALRVYENHSQLQMELISGC